MTESAPAPFPRLIGAALLLALGAACARGAAAPGGAPAAAPGDGVLARAVQSSFPLASPADAPSPGLRALAAAIGDARVVLIGEPWHGDGGAIRMRSELVRFLHDSLDFDVLAFESDFFSLTHAWQTEAASRGAAAVAADNVFPFWATSRAAQPLWEYVERQRTGPRPLHVVGIDPKHVGATAARVLPREVDRRLSELTSITPRQRAAFLEVLEHYLVREQTYRPTQADLNVFFETLDTLERGMAARPAGEREPFWEQEVRNLRAAGQYAWQGASRDRIMGENLLWIATRLHPDRKIIVWAHNNHVLADKWTYYAAPDTVIRRNLQRRSAASIARGTYLGAEAREFFGPAVYAIALLSHEGTFTPDIRTNVDPETGVYERGDFDTVRRLAPTPQGSLEAALAARHDFAFVDLRPLKGTDEGVPSRVLDYSVTPPRALRLWEGYDGLLFRRETHGLNESPR